MPIAWQQLVEMGRGSSLKTFTAAAPVSPTTLRSVGPTLPRVSLPKNWVGSGGGLICAAEASLPWGIGASGLGDLERATGSGWEADPHIIKHHPSAHAHTSSCQQAGSRSKMEIFALVLPQLLLRGSWVPGSWGSWRLACLHPNGGHKPWMATFFLPF